MIYNIGKITHKRATEILNEFKDVYNFKIYKIDRYSDVPEMGRLLAYNYGVYGFVFNIYVNEAKKRVIICGDYSGTFKNYIYLSHEDREKIWENREILDQ